MSWRNRRDNPGSLHFVTAKGVGGLPIFATNEDIRIYQALCAKEVHRSELAVNHFVFVRNHTHLLLSSPHGELHRPMQRIQEGFALHYNRTRGRAGHVFKDRFHSSHVDTRTYLFALIVYMDANVVRAGLAETATAYHYSSASFWIRPHIPRWLSRERVLCLVPGAEERGYAEETAYLKTFRGARFEFIEELIRRRLDQEKGMRDLLDEVLAPDPTDAISWILAQSRTADGTDGPRLLADAQTLQRILEARAGRTDWRGDRRRIGSTCRSLLVGLLYFACARNGSQIRAMTGLSTSTISREVHRHAELIQADPTYFRLAEDVLKAAVRETWSFVPPFVTVGPGGSTT